MSLHKHKADSMGLQEYGEYTSMIRPGTDISARLSEGGLVLLGPGEYTINEPVVLEFPTQLTLRGAGRRQTVINCTAGITIQTEDIEDYSLALCTIIEGLTLYGPSARDIDAITISWATRLRFQDVEFRRWRQAIYAQRWWDSEVISCNFLTCGNSTYPVISIEDLPNPDLTDNEIGSNSIVFLSSHVERCLGTGIFLGNQTTGVRICASKFHGDLPDAALVPHIECGTDSYANMIECCQLVNGGAECILLDDSDGNMIIGNKFQSSEIGVSFQNGSRDNVVVGNTFGIGNGSVVDEIVGVLTNNEIANNPGYVP